MGFGGTQGMITSLKNNSRIDKREAFDGWTHSDKKSKGITVEPVSEKVLKDIRNKIQLQNRTTTIKTLLVIGIGIVIMFLVIILKDH
ncbi:hypothetical protein [Aquimarina sp. SS2-1]|uniref:hypothetical protein n=1 Tax=Aquimarina besae TaxID=3342247 RepID=UPI003672E872